jgi:hypothetical protein
MNANELADELDNMLKAVGLTDNRVPIMLRQQQSEIEALKDKLKTFEILEIMVTEKLRKAQKK